MDSLKLSRAMSSKIQVCSKTSRYHLIVSSGSLLWLLSWSQILSNYSAIIAISKSLEEPADQRKQFFSLSLKQNDPRFRLEN